MSRGEGRAEHLRPASGVRYPVGLFSPLVNPLLSG